MEEFGSNNTSGLARLTADHNNRVILTLVGILILLVFMDTQARKHYQSIGTSPEQPRQKTDGARELAPLIQPRSRARAPVLTPEDREFEENYNRTMDEQLERLSGLKAELKEGTQENLPNRSAQNTQNTQAPYAMKDPAAVRPLAKSDLPPAPETVDLYYIRFQGRESVMVRVPVRYDQDRLDYARVLSMLRSGPGTDRRGLLNAFDSRVTVHSVDVRDKIAYVDVDESISRMSARIIKDRVDQMLLTLLQFPGIEGVRLFVNGRPVERLGEDGLRVPSTLGRPDRTIIEYK